MLLIVPARYSRISLRALREYPVNRAYAKVGTSGGTSSRWRLDAFITRLITFSSRFVVLSIITYDLEPTCRPIGGRSLSLRYNFVLEKHSEGKASQMKYGAQSRRFVISSFFSLRLRRAYGTNERSRFQEIHWGPNTSPRSQCTDVTYLVHDGLPPDRKRERDNKSV